LVIGYKKNIQCRILNNQYPNAGKQLPLLIIRYWVLVIGNSGNSQCKILNNQYPNAGKQLPLLIIRY
jgi:hypothetical protein